MDSVQFSWDILIEFFNEKIKISPEKFKKTYPEEINRKSLGNNLSLRVDLMHDYLRSEFVDVNTHEPALNSQIIFIAKKLDKSSKFRNLSKKFIEVDIPPPRKRKVLDADEDFIPSMDSDDEITCSSSKCKKQETEYLQKDYHKFNDMI